LSRLVDIKILSITQVVNSVGDFSPPGKTVWSNEWHAKDLELFILLKSESILLWASSPICIRQKHKIADKIASVNQA
jgi:hypothetical protein